MNGQLLKTIDELGVTAASSQESARDEELVAAAKGRMCGDGISAVAKDAPRISQNRLSCAWN